MGMQSVQEGSLACFRRKREERWEEDSRPCNHFCQAYESGNVDVVSSYAVAASLHWSTTADVAKGVS